MSFFQRTERSAEAGVEDVPEYSGKPAAPQMHCQALWYSTMHCRIVQCTVLQYNTLRYSSMHYARRKAQCKALWKALNALWSTVEHNVL